MAILNLINPSFQRFFVHPFERLLPNAANTRPCSKLQDIDWLVLNTLRTIDSHLSGRDLLQRFDTKCCALDLERLAPRATYFDGLSSDRRLALASEMAAGIVALVNAAGINRLAPFEPWLSGYDVHAGDGHWHQAATHDPRDYKDRKQPTGHLYGLNLRSGAMTHILTADQATRLKEHDMRGLKRTPYDVLRFGAPRGRKVLLVWDKAVVDFPQWYKWKQSAGIYIVTQEKENMALTPTGNLSFDRAAPVNQGVLSDELVMPSSAGFALRRIGFHDIEEDKHYTFLTTEMDLPPGIIAQTYKVRWDIEKVFDEFKNKFGEKKAWATSETAKSAQAHFMCMAHNLCLLAEHEMETRHDVRNEPETKRRDQRQAKAKTKLKSAGKEQSWVRTQIKVATQIPLKFVRWLREMMYSPGTWNGFVNALRLLYKEL